MTDEPNDTLHEGELTVTSEHRSLSALVANETAALAWLVRQMDTHKLLHSSFSATATVVQRSDEEELIEAVSITYSGVVP